MLSGLSDSFLIKAHVILTNQRLGRYSIDQVAVAVGGIMDVDILLLVSRIRDVWMMPKSVWVHRYGQCIEI